MIPRFLPYHTKLSRSRKWPGDRRNIGYTNGMVGMNNKKRPTDLGLLHSRLPIGALTSISHRISGILLVVLFPLGFILLNRSLTSEAQFADVRVWIHSGAGRVAVVLGLWLFAQHFYAGIRHLLQDIDIGIEREGAQRGAYFVWLASSATALFLARWIY